MVSVLCAIVHIGLPPCPLPVKYNSSFASITHSQIIGSQMPINSFKVILPGTESNVFLVSGLSGVKNLSNPTVNKFGSSSTGSGKFGSSSTGSDKFNRSTGETDTSSDPSASGGATGRKKTFTSRVPSVFPDKVYNPLMVVMLPPSLCSSAKLSIFICSLSLFSIRNNMSVCVSRSLSSLNRFFISCLFIFRLNFIHWYFSSTS